MVALKVSRLHGGTKGHRVDVLQDDLQRVEVARRVDHRGLPTQTNLQETPGHQAAAVLRRQDYFTMAKCYLVTVFN